MHNGTWSRIYTLWCDKNIYPTFLTSKRIIFGKSFLDTCEILLIRETLNRWLLYLHNTQL